MTERSDANHGIGALAYAWVPFALAAGASAWLAFFGGWHQTQRALGLEKRADSRESRLIKAVGEVETQTKPLLFVIQPSTPRIEDGELDGKTLTLHIRNTARVQVCFIQIRLKEVAADGTVLWADDDYADNGWNAPQQLDAGERMEASREMGDPNPRAVTLLVRAHSQEAC